MGGGRGARPRLPRAPLGAAVAGRRARARHPGVAPALATRSTSTGRPGRCTSSRGSRAAASRSTSRCTTRSSTGTPPCGCSRGACRTIPTERDTPFFFARPPQERAKREDGGAAEPTLDHLMHLLREQLGATRDVGRALMNLVRRRGRRRSRSCRRSRRRASVLNRRISRSRRFATQRIEVERLKRVARAEGGTLNDVVLALTASALRRFLLEQDALPARGADGHGAGQHPAQGRHGRRQRGRRHPGVARDRRRRSGASGSAPSSPRPGAPRSSCRGCRGTRSCSTARSSWRR